MIVRNMQPEDAKAVAEIEKSIFSLPWSAQGFLDALAQTDNIILLAECEGQIAGYVCMYVSFDEGEITNVAVDEGYRGKGFADSLLKELFVRADNKGINQIFLEVRKSNDPAKGLYCKHGFKEIGIRKNFYEFPQEDAIVMQWMR